MQILMYGPLPLIGSPAPYVHRLVVWRNVRTIYILLPRVDIWCIVTALTMLYFIYFIVYTYIGNNIK